MPFKMLFNLLGVSICVGLLFLAGRYCLQTHVCVVVVGCYLGAAFLLGRSLNGIFKG